MSDHAVSPLRRRAGYALAVVALLCSVAAVGAGSASARATLGAATTTALTVSPGSIAPGDPVTLTAVVTAATGTASPTGTVDFNINTTGGPGLIGTATLTATGSATSQASLVTNSFAAGAYSITAVYHSSSFLTFSTSTSSAVTLTVGGPVVHPTTTAVTASPSSVYAGDPVTFTAHVVESDGGATIPTGQVSFLDGSSPLGTAAVDGAGNATLTVNGFLAGSHTITASYAGDSVNQSSSGTTTISVQVPIPVAVHTTTTLTVTPSSIRAGQTVTLSAHIVQTGGTVTPPAGNDVTFTANGVFVGDAPLDASGNAVIAVPGWLTGTYDIQASYVGDVANLPSSGNAPLSVLPPASPMTITGPSVSMTYGGTVPALTPAYTGFVLGETPASLDSPATCTTTATSTSPVGTYPVTCSGASSSNYTFTYVAGSVTVNRAALTVTAPSATIAYGGTVPALAPAYSGFVAGNTVASLTTAATCTTAATSASAPGTYPVVCSGASSGNYTFSYVAGSITVTKAALTVTAPSVTTTYGAAVPALAPSYSGFAPGESAASLTAQATCTTTATAASAAGTYPVTCSGAASGNYTFTYVAGSVTVAKAVLTVTAPSVAKTYGGTTPALTPTYSGFVAGNTSASLTTQATCTTTATATSAVGTYPVTCSGAAAANYSFVYVAGTLTVSPAVLTVTANNLSMVTGATVPALTTTFTGFANGETLATSGVTGTPSCTTTATSTSPAGAYPITCTIGTLTAANYTFGFVAGTLTITAPNTSCSSARNIGNLYPSGRAPACETMLYGDPTVTAQRGDTVSVLYADETPIATGAGAPTVTINGQPVAVTVTPMYGGYLALVSFKVPTGLAYGTYTVTVSAHDSDGHSDLATFSLTVSRYDGYDYHWGWGY